MGKFQQLGRYLLVDKIARGGMADVYRGKLIGVEGFEKDIAIKRILPYWSEKREFIEMLIDEAKILLHLTHANIVQVYELNKEDDNYYIVMEFVDGLDLRALIKKLEKQGKDFPLSLACYFIHQVLTGLEYAHEKKDNRNRHLGIVHRDISPQNILISLDGNVKITDFGIAKAVGKTTETVTGTLKGKFSYMSPEQAVGEEIDRRSDLFSMGILIYEMVTGERCFKGKNDLETLEAVKNLNIKFSDELTQRIGADLKALILKALHKDKSQRYQTAAEMLMDLRKIENERGFLVAPSDFKMFLQEVFPEKFEQRKEREEELSQRTRIHLDTNVEEPPDKHRTKVLVGETQVLKDEDNMPTIVSIVKTVIFDATRIGIQKASQKIKTDIKKIKTKPTQSYLYWMALVLITVSLFGIFFSLQQENQTTISTIDPEAPPAAPTPPSPQPVPPQDTVLPVAPPTPVDVKVADDKPLLQEPQPQKPVVVIKKEDIPIPTLKTVAAQKEEDKKSQEPEKPKPQKFNAALDLTVKPKDATITVSYGKKKKTKAGLHQMQVEVADKQLFRITVAKKGYQTINQSIELTPKQTSFQKNFVLNKASYGNVVVSTRPWGRVSVPGVFSGAEGSVVRRKVPVGDYSLKVYFPPKKKTLSRRIRVRQGKTVTCQASFAAQSHMSCN